MDIVYVLKKWKSKLLSLFVLYIGQLLKLVTRVFLLEAYRIIRTPYYLEKYEIVDLCVPIFLEEACMLFLYFSSVFFSNGQLLKLSN